MASKNKDKKSSKTNSKLALKDNVLGKIKNETKQGIFAVTFFVLSVIFVLASIKTGTVGSEVYYAGPVGKEVYRLLSILLGIGYFLIPIFFLLLSISFFKKEERNFNVIKFIGGILFFVSGLGIIDLVSKQYWTAQGGKLGWVISTPLFSMFGYYASVIILLALLVISCLILFETRLTIESILFWRKAEIEDDEEDDDEDIKVIADKVEKDEKIEEEKIEKKEKKQSRGAFVKKNDVEESDIKFNPKAVNNTKYVAPPLSLLEDDKGRIVSGDIKANANIIKRTLQNFGIDVEMDEVSIGPSVTRYALKPAEGVKISRIIGLQNDLSLALAAHPLRIEAPIPGKSLGGIEIPNSVKSTVGLAALI